MTARSTLERPNAPPQAHPMGRPQVFAATMAVLLANAVAAKAIEAVGQQGPAAALVNGLGMSWAFWLAFAAGIRLAAIAPPSPAGRRDLCICAGCLVAAAVPLSQLSALACTGLALVILFDRTQGALLKAAAMVLLAISIQLLWSRLLMLVFLQPIANLDAHLVGLAIQRPVHGNAVDFVDGGSRMSILGACTSVQNASVALMMYVAVVRSFRPVPVRSELYMLLGVFLSVVAINIARLTLMAQDLRMFHLVHGDAGGAVVNGIITLTGLAWAVASVRREILD